MSKDAYYFSHDSNARNDIKIMKLRRVLGMEGYGIYFSIIEILREQKDYKLSLDSINDISFELRVSEEKIKSVIKDYELFYIEDDLFFSARLLRSMILLDSKRKKLSEAGKKGNETRWTKIDNQLLISPPDKISSPSDRHPIALKESKVKESKLNKSKVDENEEKESPPTPSIQIDNSLFENLNEDFAKYIQGCINGQMPISLKKDLAGKRDTYFQLIKNMNAFNNTIKHQRHRNEDLTAFQKRVDESIVSMLKEQRDGKFEQSWQNIADLGQHAINFFRLQTKKQEQNGTTKRNNGAIETINNDYSGNAGFN